MKQAYKTADRQVERKARLIDHRKGKELRKLAHEKTQFINEQDEKLKRKEVSKTRAAKTNEARSVVLEIRIPSEKDFAGDDEHCEATLEEAKSPRTRAKHAVKCRDVGTAKETKPQSCEIFTTQIEDYEFTDQGEIVLPVKTIREFNEEAKRGRLPDSEIELRTTNFYQDFDQIASWLTAVEKENLGHFQRTPKNSRHRNKNTESGDAKLCKSGKGKLEDEGGLLKLPRISNITESPVSSRRTKAPLKTMESLDDPRFTNLLESLTPVNGTLKLPNIARSIENKSRAS